MATVVICLITATMNMGTVEKPSYISVQDYLVGNVVTETKTEYTVDFSKEAAAKKYYGDYSKFVVGKNNCTKLNTKETK